MLGIEQARRVSGEALGRPPSQVAINKEEIREDKINETTSGDFNQRPDEKESEQELKTHQLL